MSSCLPKLNAVPSRIAYMTERAQKHNDIDNTVDHMKKIVAD